MVQNLKVDIIYHLTQSDFEMEFNLCGCCRMRLLNDKTTDRKTFIKSLARAVSRSRVIIACGPLFSDDGLIKTVASAIGSDTALCDNTTYGIESEEPIEIINGSTPLVTPDGYFGGCIIESGPQTIILLTENKGFRKTIMQHLIHPYIEEISYIPTRSAAEHQAEMQSSATVSDSENYIVETTPDYDETENTYPAYEAPLPQDEHNIEFIMDGEPEETPENEQGSAYEAPADETFDNMYTEIEENSEKKEHYEYGYTASESDNMFISKSEPEEQEKPKSKIKAMDITIIILVLILLLAVLSLVYFVVLKPYTMGISTGDYLKQIFSASGSSTLL